MMMVMIILINDDDDDNKNNNHNSYKRQAYVGSHNMNKIDEEKSTIHGNNYR